jgi:hypothetical protein
VEGFFVRYRINQYDPGGSFIISLSDSFKSFLACSIPDLHFDFNTIDVYSLDFKIYANGGDMGHFILFIDISKKNVGFSYCSISYDDNLD